MYGYGHDCPCLTLSDSAGSLTLVAVQCGSETISFALLRSATAPGLVICRELLDRTF